MNPRRAFLCLAVAACSSLVPFALPQPGPSDHPLEGDWDVEQNQISPVVTRYCVIEWDDDHDRYNYILYDQPAGTPIDHGIITTTLVGGEYTWSSTDDNGFGQISLDEGTEYAWSDLESGEGGDMNPH